MKLATLLAVGIGLTASSPSLAVYAEFVVQGQSGVIYGLRWGIVDDMPDDHVFPYTYWGNPLCVKRGTQLGVKLVWEPGDIQMPWVVQDPECQSTHNISPYWTNDDCLPTRHGWHSAGATHWFPTTMPNYVDLAHITGKILIQTPERPGESGDLVELDLPDLDSETFVVLDTPISPMATPWVNVLRHSCDWAFEADDSAEAVEKLTIGLWADGDYNGGYQAFTQEKENETNWEYFDPKGFAASLVGQCNEFADFLVCASASIGGYDLDPQMSYPYSSVYYQGNGWKLQTNAIIPAGYTNSVTPEWWYHQYAVVSGPTVYDAAAKLPDSYFVALARDSTYETSLVDRFNHYASSQIFEWFEPHHNPPWNPPTVTLTILIEW